MVSYLTSLGIDFTDVSPQEIGADTLEMDTVFTSEGIPVIWHDVSDDLRFFSSGLT